MAIPPPLRIPSDSGVTFEGFESIVIPSRQRVKDLLDSFMAAMEQAPGPMIRVILGWWGEGKTDAYGRYLRPTLSRSGDLPVFAAASTVANSYHRQDVSAVIERTSLSAVRFLVALLAAVRDENPALGISSVEGTPEEFVGRNLLKLATSGQATRKVVFFIDEFEELLLSPHLNEIISGLKEVVNAPQGPTTGVRQWLFDKGKLGGKVHFVLACTPDAYYRLESNADTSLIFGGLGRRQGVIELPPITKREGVRFLLDLLNYCYEGNLPHGFLAGPGAFDALVRASQLNLGNLVSLFTRFITYAVAQANQSVLDYSTVVDALWNQTVTAYGAQARCIETDFEDRIERGLAERSKLNIHTCRSLTRTLIGEPRPHRAEDLAERLGLGVREVKTLVNLLGETVRSSYEISPATIRVVPVHVAEDALRTEFKEWIHVEGDKANVKLDDYSESWDGFLDRISYLKDQESVGFELFLPCDEQSVLAHFEGVSTSLAGEIANKVRRLGEEETTYLPSEALLQHVFPTAVPRQLDFIRDRKVRVDTWRDVSRNLRSHFESSFAEALLSFLPYMSRYSVKDKTEIKMKQNLQVFTVVDSRNNASVRGIIYCIPGDLTSGDVDLVALHLEDLPPVHGAWVFYGGEILPEVARKIQDKGLDQSSSPKVVLVRVHPTLAKLLLASFLARKEHPKEVGTTDLEGRVRILLREDLAFEERWDQWIAAQQKAGWFVCDMVLNSASSPKEASDALRFFVNYYPEPMSPKEALERNTMDLARFVMFGSKMGLFPDIESETRLGALADDLALNGFLNREGTKFRVAFTGAEKRVLRVIEQGRLVDEDGLSEYFIIGAKQKRILKDAYLPTLEYKGFIVREHGKAKRMTKQDWDASIGARPLEPFKTLGGRLGPYGHVFVSKQRNSRLIVIDDFLSFIDSLLRRREAESVEAEETPTLRTSAMIVRLIDYFETELVPLMTRANRNGHELSEALNNKAQDMLILIERTTKDALKWTNTQISPEAIEEYAQIKLLTEESAALEPKQDPLSVVRTLHSRLPKGEYDLFLFDNTEQAASFFNLVVHQRLAFASKLEGLDARCAKPLTEIARGFADIEGRQRAFNRALGELKPSSGLATGKFVQALARLGSPGGDMPPNKLMKSDLDSLEKIVTSILAQLSDLYSQSQNALNLAQVLIQAELSFSVAAQKATGYVAKVQGLLTEIGTPAVAEVFKRIGTNIESCSTQLASEAVPASLRDLVATMRFLVKVAETASGQLQEDTDALSRSWRAFANRQVEILGQVTKVTEVVAENQKKNVPPKLQRAIDDLTAEMTKGLDKTSLDEKSIRSGRETITKELASLAKGFLSENALLVLTALIGGSSGRATSWISFDELADEVRNRYGIDRPLFEELVTELQGARIVVEGLALRG